MRRRALLGLVIIALAVAGIALLRPAGKPDARFPTLAGKSLAISELRGKVVLVDFWATDCEPCVEEMPQLVQNYRRFAPRGYEVVAVAMASDHPNRVADFTRRAALPFTVGLDLDGKAAQAFGDVQVTPSHFLLGKDGRVVKQWRGRTDWRSLSADIEKALAS